MLFRGCNQPVQPVKGDDSIKSNFDDVLWQQKVAEKVPKTDPNAIARLSAVATRRRPLRGALARKKGTPGLLFRQRAHNTVQVLKPAIPQTLHNGHLPMSPAVDPNEFRWIQRKTGDGLIYNNVAHNVFTKPCLCPGALLARVIATPVLARLCPQQTTRALGREAGALAIGVRGLAVPQLPAS